MSPFNHYSKIIISVFSLIIISSFTFLFAENNVLVEEKNINKAEEIASSMDSYTENKKIQWSFNPYKRNFEDKYFNPWVDPLSYNSFWFMYYPPKVREYYDAERFKLDNVLFYHNPQLGTQISPIAFAFDNLKYRFYIGVGFLMSGHFLMLGGGATQYYGTHIFLNSLIQVEPYIDFIYKDNLRIRLTPIRHICYHMSGDILGDSNLHKNSQTISPSDKYYKTDKYKDIGFEQIHASVNYRWGWFNFYGGLAGAVTNINVCTCINLFNFYGGAEMKYPILGDLNLIAGLHLGGNYDKLGDLTHHIDTNTYSLSNVYYEFTPVISAGVGLGIHDWIIGFKFDYMRSRQIYAVEHMEMRMGLSACLYL